MCSSDLASSPETLPKSSEMDEDVPDALPAAEAATGNSDEETMEAIGRRRKTRLVISDDED